MNVRLLGMAVAALAVILVAGCSYVPAPLEAWPEEPSCGRYENRNEPASAEQRRKNECLLDAAAAGRPAELVVTYYTVEGDPITSYYRVVGPRRIEILVDSTRDSFGAQEWTHQLCAEIVQDSSFLYGDTCHEIPVDRSVP